MRGLGIFVLSHNRPDTLRVTLNSLPTDVFSHVYVCDNSSPENSEIVRNICASIGIEFYREEQSGLTSNLTRAVGEMRENIHYMLLCDDDKVDLSDMSEITASFAQNYVYVMPATQSGVEGYRGFNRGLQSPLVSRFAKFPNLGFAGCFIPSLTYKNSLGEIERFGGRFDLFLLSQIAEMPIFISSKNRYVFTEHEDQMSRAITLKSVVIFAGLAMRSQVKKNRNYFYFINCIAIFHELKHLAKKKILG